VLMPYSEHNVSCVQMVCSREEPWIETSEDWPLDNVSIPFERPADSTSVGNQKPMCTDDDAQCNCPIQHEFSNCSCNDPYLICEYDTGILSCRYNGKNCDKPVNCSFSRASHFRICLTDGTRYTGTPYTGIVLTPFSEHNESCDQTVHCIGESWIETTEKRPGDYFTSSFERPGDNASLQMWQMCPDGSAVECLYVLDYRWPFSVCRDSRLLCSYNVVYHSKNYFSCWHRDMDCSGPAYCPTLIDSTAYICRTDGSAQIVLQPFNDFHEQCDRIVCSANETSTETTPFSDTIDSPERSSECPGGVDECDCVLSERWPFCNCRDTHLVCMYTYDYNNGVQIFQCWHDSLACNEPVYCQAMPRHRSYICGVHGSEQIVLQPFRGLGEYCEDEEIQCRNKTSTSQKLTHSVEQQDTTTSLPDNMPTTLFGTCIALRFSISGHLYRR